MASLSTIARPYAKATFAVASQNKLEAQWSSVLRVLQLALSDALLGGLLKNPAVSHSDWQRLLMGLCEDALPEETRAVGDSLANFIALLLESSRLAILQEVFTVFHTLHLKSQSIVEVEMISAYQVSDSEQTRIRALLEKRFSAAIDWNFSVDSSLIGGALLRSGDWVMDGSIKRKITRLADKLSS